MITDAKAQFFLFVLFTAAGLALYLPYVALSLLPAKKRLPVTSHILDGLWAVLFCLAFVALSHFAYDGQIKYFTVASYVFGAFLSNLCIKKPFVRLLTHLHNKYTSAKNVHTDTNGAQNGPDKRNKTQKGARGA